MTDAPAGAPAPPASRPGSAARPPRRSLTEIAVPWADEATLRAQSERLGEPDWLTADRVAGLAAFNSLPIETNQLYTTYVDLRRVDLSATALAGATPARPESVQRAPALPDDVAAIVEINERGVATVSIGDEANQSGLIVETLEAFRERDPDGFQRAIETPGALPNDDKLAQLTRAFWRTGVHVAIPSGARLAKPVVLRWMIDSPVALLSRTIIETGEDSELKVVEELGSSEAEWAGGGQALLAGTSELRLGDGSNLSLASLQELSTSVVAFQHRTAAIGSNAHLHWALAHLGCRLVRSRVDNRLEGNGGSVEQVEIVFGSGDQLFDLTSYTRHVGKNATSNLLSKAALQDAARTFLKGLVTIDKSGSGTDSFLGEYGMNLSKKARAVAIPSLEIDQPDCRRVAHSSSVGPIDETQLFYLESRGISPLDARKFIVLGFLEPVVARVPLASAQERLRDLLEAKWDAAHEDPASAA